MYGDDNTIYCHVASCALEQGGVRRGATKASFSMCWYDNARQRGRSDLDHQSRTAFLVSTEMHG